MKKTCQSNCQSNYLCLTAWVKMLGWPKSTERTGFRSQMMSSALHLSTLHCMSFILSFSLGLPRIQGFCIISQATVPRFFIRTLRISSLPVPWLPHPTVIPPFPKADKQVSAKWPGRSHSFRPEGLGCILSSITPVLYVLGQLISPLWTSVSPSVECHFLVKLPPSTCPPPPS